MTLLLIRHPAPEIAPGICYGRLDLALRADAAPAVAAIVAAARAARVRAVWSSPAQRCLGPARAAATAAGARLVIDDRLQELDFGAWEGRPWGDVDRAALDRWAADPLGFAPPGGESGRALCERVAAVHRDLAAAEAAADAAVITHGGPLRVLLALARGEAPDLLVAAPAFGAVIAVTG